MMHFLSKQASGGWTDGVRGGGGTSEHWLSAALRSVQSQEKQLHDSRCVCDGEHSAWGWCERRDLRVFRLNSELNAQLVFIAWDVHDGFPVALSVDQRKGVNTCTSTAKFHMWVGCFYLHILSCDWFCFYRQHAKKVCNYLFAKSYICSRKSLIVSLKSS